jgi:predicted patatin/cPLA2 family phospholipase
MRDGVQAQEATEQPGTAVAGRRIGLALSGGGVRAAVFHLGVLKRVAAENLLEEVSAVSTVSGGSLITAAMSRWPVCGGRRRATFSTTFCLRCAVG